MVMIMIVVMIIIVMVFVLEESTTFPKHKICCNQQDITQEEKEICFHETSIQK